LIKVRKDYEALNDQLLDELPTLIQNAQKIIKNSIISFVYLTNQFIQSLNCTLKDNIKVIEQFDTVLYRFLFTRLLIFTLIDQSTSLEFQHFNQAVLIIKLYTMNKLFKRDSLTASNEPMRSLASSYVSKPAYKLQVYKFSIKIF
jgi:hypothetical protein